MTVVIPQWVFDRMVEKYGPEEANRTIEQLGVTVGENWLDVNDNNEKPQGGTDGLG